jgi:putative salt-induced outer membrane protein
MRKALACGRAIVATAFALGCLASAHAQWSGKGQLGFVEARGNTDTSALNAGIDFKDIDGAWTHTFGASALRADTSGVTTADRYEFHEQSNYAISPQSYLLGGAHFEHDDFSSFAHQGAVEAGYGYKFIDASDTKLAGEIGAGYRRSEIRASGQNEGDAIGRLAMNFEHSFNAATKVTDKLAVESGKDDTFTTNDLGLQVKMSDKLALGVDYTVRHHSIVVEAPGTVIYKTDQLTTVNLVYSF